MIKIKNFFPEADIIQIQTDTYEVVIHRSKEGEVFVDVREFETNIETNLILGEGQTEEIHDDLDGDTFAKNRSFN